MECKTLGPLAALTLQILSTPLAVNAQELAKMPRIGVLDSGDPSTSASLDKVFREELRRVGYIVGENIAIEQRWAGRRINRLPDLAAELVRLRVSVIVAAEEPVILAAKQATSTIPIVMSSVGDPVGAGFVASLKRPGGNITGVTNFVVGLVPKWLALLKEVMPEIARVAILGNAASRTHDVLLKEAERAAKRQGLKVIALAVRNPEEFEGAFATIARAGAGALLILPDPTLYRQHERLVALAAKDRLPTIYAAREPVEAGGFIFYGPSERDNHRRAATYVDKILKGAKPADLPVKRPTKFELVINVKTAKSIGLTIPKSFLLRADQVIE